MEQQAVVRQENKTIEQHFVRTLINDFQFAPRLAEAVLAEAQASLVAVGQEPGGGQIRLVLSQRQAGAGRTLDLVPSIEVRWTINAGAEDQAVLQQHGRVALRRVRIQRLLDEALEQGGVATQEDLAVALNVGLRTIKRDCHVLEQEGVYLPTRGNLHGIGRGQTHKAQIIGRWLRGETYDQLMVRTRHSSTSIRRYVQTFVRVVELHRQAFSLSQIAQLVQSGEALIREYLAVYDQNDTPECRQRLEEQLQRLRRGDTVPDGLKKGAR
jgi:hypothetical protein